MTTDKQASGQNRVVVTSRGAGLAQDVRAGDHTLSADESPPAGTDAGPDPYALLLASLGSCTAMTIQLYAERKGLNLEGVTIALSHSRRYVDDCRDCEEGKPKRLDHIDREIGLRGELSAEERERLFEIADKCPVSRTLQAEIRIETHRGDAASGDGDAGPVSPSG